MLAAFIVNATIKNKKSWLQELWRTQEKYPAITIKVFETGFHNQAIDLAALAAHQQFDFIIAVGGDGTLNQVVNGFLQARSTKPISIGVLPAGTGNDFVKTLGTPDNIKDIFDMMQQHQSTLVDVGRIEYMDVIGRKQERFFINVADAGMGADVVHRVNSSTKRWGSQITYIKAIVQTFLDFKHKHISLKTDDWSWEGDAMAIVVANGKYFGAGLGIAPDAETGDGFFNVTILGKISVWDYLKNLPRLKKLKHITHKEIHYKHASRIELNSTDKNCGLEADGEFFGYLPATIEVLHQRLRFLKK